jgi:serine/threonine protein kinase/Tfp pilus assembly protein PilF
MSANAPDRIEHLFRAARRRPPEERAAFLDAACADDPVLRRELDSLLCADQDADAEGFLDEPLGGWISQLGNTGKGSGLTGRSIGPYMLLRLLGSGGMGDVYLALREEPFTHYVALKVIRLGMDTREVLQRFEMERQILAALNHPGIARLLDGGMSEDGRPYFVMEYVEGLPITTYCDKNRLGVDERLRLFQAVCQAVHHAHRNLVLHRDLKPSNILVTREGLVKLLDFGVAKLLNPNLTQVTMPVTRLALPVMTPEYASPEQVRGETLTTASDVYALGVVLNELLTGHRPYRLAMGSAQEIPQVICEQDPERPSTKVMCTESVTLPDGSTQEITPAKVGAARNTSAERLRRRLRGDLDNIVLMALRKEANRRYTSAEQLGVEIERYLQGQPVIAHRDTRRYRLKKFVRRHQVETVAAVLVLLSLLGGLGGALMQAEQTRRERDRAERALVQTKQTLEQSEEVTNFLITLFQANDPLEARGDSVTARELLERGVAQAEMLAEQPLIQAQMLDVMGRVYRNLGHYAQAQPLLERALALRRGHLGASHVDVAQSLIHLATLRLDRGEHEAAEALYQEALAIQRQLLGEAHADVARSLNLLATVLRHKGNYDAAEALYRQALRAYQSMDEEHPEEAAVMNNLAMVLRQKGEYAAAETLHRQALDVQRRQLGETHPYVATSLSNVAVTLYFQSELDAAEPMAREVLALRQKLFGQEHPSVATSLNLLALILQARGEYDAAESVYRQALAMRRTLLGEEHADVALSMQNLAMLLRDKGEYVAAEALHRQALTMRRRLLRKDHPDIAMSLWHLASVLCKEGRFSEAEALYLEALAIFSSQFDEQYVGVQTIYERLIELYEAWGKPEQATPYRALLRPSGSR